MDITVTIPKELEPVVEYWEKKNSVAMADWLTSIAVGNLKADADKVYNDEVVEKTVTLDAKVKAVDWTAKVTAMTPAVEVVEEPLEELKGEGLEAGGEEEPVLGP